MSYIWQTHNVDSIFMKIKQKMFIRIRKSYAVIFVCKMVKTCLKLIENILTWPFPECLNWMPFWTYENISHVCKQNLEFKAQMDRIIIIFYVYKKKNTTGNIYVGIGDPTINAK